MVLGFSVSSALGGMPLFGPAVVPVRVLADSYGYFMRPGLPWQAIPIVSGRVTPKALRKASKGVSQVSLRLGWGSVRTRSELREFEFCARCASLSACASVGLLCGACSPPSQPVVLREIEKVAWPCVPLVLGFSVSSALGGMPLFWSCCCTCSCSSR